MPRAGTRTAHKSGTGWPVPERVLDLFTEFRNQTNGIPTGNGAGLLGALAYHGLDGIGATEKDEMRDLVLRGGPWSDTERAAILDYCASDVAALARLLPAMLPKIDLPRALLRGRYMAALARMERKGVPIDVGTLDHLRRNWWLIQDQLIAEIDADYGVYDGRTFKAERFATWLAQAGIPWPRLESGRLDLSDDAFREMARGYPKIAPLRELRGALSEMRLSDLAVGRDGRNRAMLSAFRARTDCRATIKNRLRQSADTPLVERRARQPEAATVAKGQDLLAGENNRLWAAR